MPPSHVPEAGASHLLACVRALRVLLHVLVGLVLVAAVQLTRTLLPRERLTQWWNAMLLDLMNVHLTCHGAPAAGARLSVANHVSWLDICVIVACEPTRFVAKSEVRHWPVAGWLADAAGTFFIRRGKGGSGALLKQLTPHLAHGGSVVMFPEGTTTDGRNLREFHPRLFAAAINARCRVQPIAIRYDNDICAFVGDDNLVSHLWRLLQQPALSAEISYCAPIMADGCERDALALRAQASIRAALECALPTGETEQEPLCGQIASA